MIICSRAAWSRCCCLLLLTPAVPAGWTGMWAFWTLAAAAALPVLAMTWMWAVLARSAPVEGIDSVVEPSGKDDR
ncbi:MAG: hypothetical protein U5K31_06810 [Balneolaceae bacterium]|nr:hypothetical protein [Balneolaceae bacterium]